MPSPWVTRALAKELPAKELSPFASPESGVVTSTEEDSLGPVLEEDGIPSDVTLAMFDIRPVCRRARVTGDCPFSHEWLDIAGRMLPIITYGSREEHGQ